MNPLEPFQTKINIYQSLAADKQGNLTRRLIFDVPILGIKITKDILAVKIKDAQSSSGLEDGIESEEGDVHINATLASRNAGGLAMRGLRTREERDILISESESLVDLIVTFVVFFFCALCWVLCLKRVLI